MLLPRLLFLFLSSRRGRHDFKRASVSNPCFTGRRETGTNKWLIICNCRTFDGFEGTSRNRRTRTIRVFRSFTQSQRESTGREVGSYKGKLEPPFHCRPLPSVNAHTFTPNATRPRTFDFESRVDSYIAMSQKFLDKFFPACRSTSRLYSGDASL